MPLEMRNEVFITAAITGSGSTQNRSDLVPRSPKQIAEAVYTFNGLIYKLSINLKADQNFFICSIVPILTLKEPFKLIFLSILLTRIPGLHLISVSFSLS